MSRKLFCLAAAAGLPAVFLATAAVADRDLASVARYARGTVATIDVTAHYLAPSPCYSYVANSRTAPGGATVPDIAVPLTIVVDKGPGSCPNDPTLLRGTFIVFPQGNTINVKVFFVSPSGKRLKTEEIAILPN